MTKFVLRILAAVLFLLPILWMTAAALHPPGTPLPTTIWLLPEHPTLDNFRRIFTLVPLGRFTLNSLLVTAVAIPLTLLTGSWAGFAIPRLPQSSQRRWVFISLVVLLIPGIALWSTRFLVYRWLGWLDTIWALVGPAWMGTSPFFVLMFYRAFRRIPSLIYDAARIDGAGLLATWGLVAFPIARPTALAVAVLTFILYWSDFTGPLLYLSSQERYTLPVALQLLQQLSRSEWSLLMAGAIWATAVPLLLVAAVVVYIQMNNRTRTNANER
jgi:multiple sugar transport system permease protein